jgi:hypothetical protein
MCALGKEIMLPLLLLLGALAEPAVAPGPLDGGRAIRTYTQHLRGTPQEVFPLLGPLAEREWAHEGWAPQFIYPIPGRDEPGCVFVTRSHGEETLWVLTAFDAQRLVVEYLLLTAGNRVAQLHIALLPERGDRSTARISYTWTALGETGRQFIVAHRGAAFDAGMHEWETELNAYLERRHGN